MSGQYALTEDEIEIIMKILDNHDVVLSVYSENDEEVLKDISIKITSDGEKRFYIQDD